MIPVDLRHRNTMSKTAPGSPQRAPSVAEVAVAGMPAALPEWVGLPAEGHEAADLRPDQPCRLPRSKHRYWMKRTTLSEALPIPLSPAGTGTIPP